MSFISKKRNIVFSNLIKKGTLFFFDDFKEKQRSVLSNFYEIDFSFFQKMEPHFKFRILRTNVSEIRNLERLLNNYN